MKYGIKGMLCLLLVLLLTGGCGITAGPEKNLSPTAATSEKRLTILTSFYPMYIMTLNIVRDLPDVRVVNLTRPFTGCLHDYQLTPDDLKQVENAQILVVNGAGMESFLDKVIKQQPELKIVEASRGIPLIPLASNKLEGNPHIWVSVSGAIQEVKNIAEQLSDLDPANAETYQVNAVEYVKKLELLREEMHQELAGFSNSSIVTFHEAFPYFAREFNLKVVAVIEYEPGSEPSAAELAEAIQTVRKTNTKAIFTEPQYPTRAAEAIARETGVPVCVLDPAVTGPYELDAYLDIMRKNLKTLKEVLQ